MRTVGGIEFDVERIISGFNSRVDYVRVEDIKLRRVPREPRLILERASKRFMSPEEYKGLEQIMSLEFDYSNGDFGYGLIYPTKYSNGDSEISLYFIEYNKKKEETGHAELRYNYSNPSPYFKDKPFIGWVSTEERYQRQGLGIRKHRVMNALALAIYDKVLHADTVMTEYEFKVWKKLVELGEARHYLEKKKLDRFCFI